MKTHIHILGIVLTFFGLLLFGTLVYHSIEGWGYVDSVYFSFVTMTTIGYGDVVPMTDAGKIFTMVFAFFGIALVFYLVSVIGRKLFSEHVAQRISQMKQEVKGEEKVLKEVKSVVQKKRKKKK